MENGWFEILLFLNILYSDDFLIEMISDLLAELLYLTLVEEGE